MKNASITYLRLLACVTLLASARMAGAEKSADWESQSLAQYAQQWGSLMCMQDMSPQARICNAQSTLGSAAREYLEAGCDTEPQQSSATCQKLERNIEHAKHRLRKTHEESDKLPAEPCIGWCATRERARFMRPAQPAPSEI